MLIYEKKHLVRKYLAFLKFNLTCCTDQDFLVYLYSFKDFDNPRSPFNVYLYFQEYMEYFYDSIFKSEEDFPLGVRVINDDQDLSDNFKYKLINTSVERSTGKVYRKEHPITGKTWFVIIEKDCFDNIELFYAMLKTLYSQYKDKLETKEYVPKYAYPLPNLREIYHKRIYQ